MRLFEFEDLDWFPNFLREGMTDYLRFVLNAVDFYYPATTIIKEGLENAERFIIIDLCSGGGGAIKKKKNNGMKNYNSQYCKNIFITTVKNSNGLPGFYSILQY